MSPEARQIEILKNVVDILKSDRARLSAEVEVLTMLVRSHSPPDVLAALVDCERALSAAVIAATDVSDFDVGEHVAIKAARTAIKNARGEP